MVKNRKERTNPDKEIEDYFKSKRTDSNRTLNLNPIIYLQLILLLFKAFWLKDMPWYWTMSPFIFIGTLVAIVFIIAVILAVRK